MGNGGTKKKLINKYGPICFLGDIPSKNNVITYHHIKPVREGKETTVENGALLTDRMHWLFNAIERIDPETAEYINNYFKYYKETQDESARIKMYHFVIKYYFLYSIDKPHEITTFKKKILTR